MKNILILTYCYPPSRYVASQRPAALAHYLRDKGHRVTVVTRDWGSDGGVSYFGASPDSDVNTDVEDGIKVVKAPFRNVYSRAEKALDQHAGGMRQAWYSTLRRGATASSYLGQFFFPVGPMATLYKTARAYLQKHPCDAIIAHGEPFVLFSYCKRLSKAFGIPWLADYRDPWSLDLMASIHPINRAALRFIERRTSASASAVVCATDYVGRNILVQQEPTVVQNGHNLDQALLDHLPLPGKERLEVTLAGTLKPWNPWWTVIDVFDRVAKSSERPIVLRFIGTKSNDAIKAYLQGKALSCTVEVLDRMEHETSLEYLAKSHAVLLFNNYALLGTKVFEYLGLKRWILFCFDSRFSYDADAAQHERCARMKGINVDCQQALIERHEGGCILAHAADLQTELERLLVKLEQGDGFTAPSRGVEQLGRQQQLRGFDKALHALMG